MLRTTASSFIVMFCFHEYYSTQILANNCFNKMPVSLVSHGQTLYLRRALSIRDDKRPRKKGLEQFTVSTGTAISVVVMGVDCIVVFW